MGNLRLEIQSLRAVAVLAIVIYHFWPTRLTGGYVGVDIFFVISGFLITGHILKGFRGEKKFSFVGFYARRARRILPAASIVLLVVFLVSLFFTNAESFAPHVGQIIWSTLFVENWALIVQSTNYLVATGPDSPVQHFWSLSVEEQFYLVWPALVVMGIWLGRHRIRNTSNKFLLVLLFCLTCASLVWSIVSSVKEPDVAYFSTFTRAWEFGIGGLLAAFGAEKIVKWVWIRYLALGLGAVLIAGTIFFFTPLTPFPSYWALLPVCGTAIIIWARVTSREKWLQAVVANRLVLWIAGISFSLYLWHWPVLVFAQYFYGKDLPSWSKVLLIGLSLVLAWVTTRFVENPIRFSPALAGIKSRKILALAVVCITATALLPASSLVVVSRSLSDTTALNVAENPDMSTNHLMPCNGAEAMDLSLVCDRNVIPNFSLQNNRDAIGLNSIGCGNLEDSSHLSCSFGDPKSEVKVALVGDSHAKSIFHGILPIANAQHWNLITYTKPGCSWTADPQSSVGCSNWRDWVQRQILEGNFSLVITTKRDSPAAEQFNLPLTSAELITAQRKVWQPVLDANIPIIVIQDNPQIPNRYMECLRTNKEHWQSCTPTLSEAYDYESSLARASADIPGVSLINLTPFYCTKEVCPLVAGGIPIYADGSHLTFAYAETLAPYIATAVYKISPNLFRF